MTGMLTVMAANEAAVTMDEAAAIGTASGVWDDILSPFGSATLLHNP